MKKAFIFIAVIALLITLLIPNIAIAQDCTVNVEPAYPGENTDCTVSVEPGCAGENTITGKVAGWTETGVIAVKIYYHIENIDTGVKIYNDFYNYDITKDPFIVSYSIDLPAGDYWSYGGYSVYYEGDIWWYQWCWFDCYFTVVECPEPEPEPCDDCSLIVQKRDEDGYPIDGAVFKVDGIEKIIRGGEARWDDLECDTTYEVREISPIKQSKRIHLGDCGERSTLKIVNKEEEEVEEKTKPKPWERTDIGSYEKTDTGFTTLFYSRFFRRPPDQAGLDSWVARLESGAVTGADLVKGFIFGEECQTKISDYTNEQFITFLYKALFNRVPDTEGYNAWLARMSAGMTKEEVVNGFTDSVEFKNICYGFGILPNIEEYKIALEIVKLTKSQIGKLTGDGAFTGLIWADSEITYCDRFVSAAVAIATGKPLSERKRHNTAYDDYIANKGLIKSGEPPKGAVVYFGKHAENKNYGHVGISDGEGNIISVVDITRGVISVPLKNFKAPVLGWITPEERI